MLKCIDAHLLLFLEKVVSQILLSCGAVSLFCNYGGVALRNARTQKANIE